MPRIPLEDNYDDVLNKAQRGLNLSDDDLARRAEVSLEDLRALKAGKFNEAVARRAASHLQLNREALVQLAVKGWYPQPPQFNGGFAAFNTTVDGMAVNNYLIWDQRTKHAAIFDTGGDASPTLDTIASEKIKVRYIFLTHTHDDHVAQLDILREKTGAEVWVSEHEPFADAKTFSENAFFHVGPLAVKTLLTNGHSSGGTTFYITGLSYPLAIVGDSLFASSMGGTSPDVWTQAVENNRKKILALSADTVLACGHGPLTTVGQEKKHNPFFAR